MKSYIITRRGARGGILEKKTYKQAYGYTLRDRCYYFHHKEDLTDFVDFIREDTVDAIRERGESPEIPYGSIEI